MLLQRPPQSGFILLFVIGLLIFLSVTGMGIAYALRVNAQLVINERQTVRDDLVLESGVQYAVAQLIKARLAEPVANARGLKDIELWKPDGGPWRPTLLGETVEIAIEDAGDLPDLNVLSLEEIRRLFRVLGADDAAAGRLAETLVSARDQAAAARGGPGFDSLDEVLALDAIPARYRLGDAQSDPPAAGLDQLVAVGTEIRTVNVNRAPLAVVAALTDAAPADLTRFDAARRARPLTLTEAAGLLGENAGQALRDSASPAARIRVRLAGRRAGVALIREEDGRFRTLSYRAQAETAAR